MVDQTSGLRFDIYERVHLPDHVDGIFELEEIELTPHIHVQENEEKTLLKGHLRLSGTYVAEGGAEESRLLDYRIPVEITLPMNRSSQNLEQVGAEIENFDVDLISTRSLNVTGVLTLRGVTLDDQQEGQWDQEDEVVFVHQTADSAADLVAEADEESEDEKSEDAKAGGEDAQHAAQEPDEPELVKELKIAFSGKKMLEEPSVDATEPEPLPPVSAVSTAEPPAAAAAVQSPASDALEWKKLFLPANQEARFSRMKMCIVQKEETVETIAERYGMNSREIILFNRLGEQGITEGQILYIPK